MVRFFIALAMIFMINLPSFASVVQGGVEKELVIGQNKIIDSVTNATVSGARVYLPQQNYMTYTDENGVFTLDANITGTTVLSINKNGYKPYSITIDQNANSNPMVLAIEKATPYDIIVDNEMFHLGDNSYSDLSANAGEFKVQSVGPYYSKKIKIPNIAQGTSVNLIIGSIIGVDTQMAKSMGQNKVHEAYASPPEVYFNGNKIAEIQVNGDGQKIRVPYNLVRQNQMNEITIKTGRNLMQTAYVDYDDIEFMNLTVETK